MTFAATLAAVAVAAAATACGNSGTEPAASSPSVTATNSTAPTAGRNSADAMFVQHMIPHHQQAIEMSDMILGKQGIDPRVTDLATQIKSAQAPEIERMQGWRNSGACLRCR